MKIQGGPINILVERFTSLANRDYHWAEHKGEFPGLTVDDYEALAKKLAYTDADGKTVIGYTSKGTDDLYHKYDTVTTDYTIYKKAQDGERLNITLHRKPMRRYKSVKHRDKGVDLPPGSTS